MKDIIITSLDKRIKNIINDLPRNGNFQLRKESAITHISVHHTASKMGQFNTKDFARWHMDPNGIFKEYGGAPAICYHFGITGEGIIEQVNTLDQTSWHTIGVNHCAIGIELNGNFQNEEPTVEQLDSLKWLCNYLCVVLDKRLIIKGHKQYPGNATACPGKNLLNKLADL